MVLLSNNCLYVCVWERRTDPWYYCPITVCMFVFGRGGLIRGTIVQ